MPVMECRCRLSPHDNNEAASRTAATVGASGSQTGHSRGELQSSPATLASGHTAGNA